LSARCRRVSATLADAAAYHGHAWPPALGPLPHAWRLRAAGAALEGALPPQGVAAAQRARAWANESASRQSVRVAAAVVGVVLFAALGGQRLSFSPSNVRHLGAFARQVA
jgi:hypothetical protein